MKEENLIVTNLNQKLGIWMAGMESTKLKEHIRMLDWVMSDEPEVRSINEIVERCKK